MSASVGIVVFCDGKPCAHNQDTRNMFDAGQELATATRMAAAEHGWTHPTPGRDVCPRCTEWERARSASPSILDDP